MEVFLKLKTNRLASHTGSLLNEQIMILFPKVKLGPAFARLFVDLLWDQLHPEKFFLMFTDDSLLFVHLHRTFLRYPERIHPGLYLPVIAS